MIYAVVTGDLVNSSKVEKEDKTTLINSLKEAFGKIEATDQAHGKSQRAGFNIFRGDSFQGVLSQPQDALRASLFIRSAMRKNQPAQKDYSWDARMAIGLGRIDHLPENISEGDGPAYRHSGPVLDAMKGDHRLAITTPWPHLNDEFKASSALLDVIVAKWTAAQAETIWFLLQGLSAQKIAGKLDISPAAVHYRIKGAGWFAIQLFLKRFQNSTTTALKS